MALSGTSGSYKLFLNGTQEGSPSSNGFTAGTTNKYIGTFYWAGVGGAVRFVNGYIEDFRITKGEARYTSNFTPPTSAHLTSAGDVNKQIVVNSGADGVAIGTGGINQARIAKAWANIDGTGTPSLEDSYNVSSLTDTATGRYTLNFSTALANGHYAWAGSAGNEGATTSGRDVTNDGTRTTSALPIRVTYFDSSNTAIDDAYVGIIVFGN